MDLEEDRWFCFVIFQHRPSLQLHILTRWNYISFEWILFRTKLIWENFSNEYLNFAWNNFELDKGEVFLLDNKKGRMEKRKFLEVGSMLFWEKRVKDGKWKVRGIEIFEVETEGSASGTAPAPVGEFVPVTSAIDVWVRSRTPEDGPDFFALFASGIRGAFPWKQRPLRLRLLPQIQSLEYLDYGHFPVQRVEVHTEEPGARQVEAHLGRLFDSVRANCWHNWCIQYRTM